MKLWTQEKKTWREEEAVREWVVLLNKGIKKNNLN